MKLSSADAALLSPEERALVRASGPWQVKDLVRTIERTRRLRDKARDLLQRQTVATRRSGRGNERKAPNARSADRARVFERALDDFRRQLAALDADSSQAMREVGADAGSRRTARKSATGKSARKAAAKKSATKKSTARKSTAKKATGKPAARKSAAKKPAAKKSTANKSTAKKSTAKKATAKKSTARKSPAKKSAARKTSATGTAAKRPATKSATAKRTATKTVATRKSPPKKPAAKQSAGANTAGRMAAARNATPQQPAADRGAPTPRRPKRPKPPVVRRVYAGQEPETHGPPSGPPQVEISSKARIPIPRELGSPFAGAPAGKQFQRTRALKSRRG
jgi:hypothetical protein